MEAKLHKELTEKLNPKLEKYLKEHGIDSFDINSLYLGNWISDFSQLIDEGVKSRIYNFLIVPKDFASNIQQLIDLLQSYFPSESIILDLHRVHEELQKIPKSWSTFTLSDIKKILMEKDGTFPDAFNDLKFLRDSIIGELKNLKFNLEIDFTIISSDITSMEEAKENKSLKSIEYGLFNLVKLIGFKKFNVGETGEIDFANFNNITNKLLKPYSPAHHLDRSLVYSRLTHATKNDLEKNIYLYLVDEPQTNEGINLLNELEGSNPFQNLIGVNENPPYKENEVNLSKSEDLSSILQLNKDHDYVDLYGYLKEYLLVACGQLTELDLYFKELNSLSDPKELNVKLAELGKTFHIFEDFYSHSNYIDFSILSLFQVYKSTNLSHYKDDYLIKALFEGSKDNKLAFTNFEMNKVVRSLVKTEKDPKNIDFKITTGYFGSKDIFVSLFHVLVGEIKDRISDLDEKKSLKENIEKTLRTEVIDEQKKILLKVQSVEQLKVKKSELELKKEMELKLLERKRDHSIQILEKDSSIFPEQISILKIAIINDYNRNKELLEERYDEEIKMIDEFVKDYERFKKIRQKVDFISFNFKKDPPEYITDKEIGEIFEGFTINEKAGAYLKKAVNYFILAKDIHHVYKFGKSYYEAFKRVHQITKIIKTLLRVVSILLRYPHALIPVIKLFIQKLPVPLKNLIKKYLLQVIEDIVVHGLENIKDYFLKEDEFATGSHSLMAKDEAYEKPKLNDIAMKMAGYVDMVIFENMFTYQNKDYCVDWYTLVKLYCFSYPNIKIDYLPSHQISCLKNYNRRLNLHDIRHKSWYEANEKKCYELQKSNEEPYTGKNTTVILRSAPPKPGKVSIGENYSRSPINPDILELFNYQIILKGDKDVKNVIIPTIDKIKARKFLEETKIIEEGIRNFYLDAAITEKYLIKS